MRKICAYIVAGAILLLVHGPVALAHWPGQAPHQFADLGEFEFEGGGKIANLRMSYVTHGKLNAAKDNAIMFEPGWIPSYANSAAIRVAPWNPWSIRSFFVAGFLPSELAFIRVHSRFHPAATFRPPTGL